MELAISAVTGELVSRFVSYLADRYRSSRRPQSGEKQLRRLQQLLLRARTVVEEADGRYITNSGMLAQLTMLADAMYRGYWALGAFGYMSLEETETSPRRRRRGRLAAHLPANVFARFMAVLGRTRPSTLPTCKVWWRAWRTLSLA